MPSVSLSESEFFQWVKSELKQHFALIKKDKVHMKICKPGHFMEITHYNAGYMENV